MQPRRSSLALLVSAIFWTWGTGAAQACSCAAISPEAGLDHAQYVFTGKVVKAEQHVWIVEVECVWKGHEKLRHTIKLMDAYAGMDCEFFFELGQRYLFFAIVAKGSRDVFYHPQACNWTSRLDESQWLEDWLIRQQGPGEKPRGDDLSK
jgi:hypothetical protein